MSINEGKTISEALFQDRHLFLHGDINGDMASAIIAGLLALSNSRYLCIFFQEAVKFILV